MRKKINFIMICLILLFSISMVGCNSENNSLAYSIDYNLDRLSNVLNNTKEASNSEIIISELYSIDDSDTKQSETNNELSTKISTLKNSESTIIYLVSLC